MHFILLSAVNLEFPPWEINKKVLSYLIAHVSIGMVELWITVATAKLTSTVAIFSLCWNAGRTKIHTFIQPFSKSMFSFLTVEVI